MWGTRPSLSPPVADPRPGLRYRLATATGPDGRPLVLRVLECKPATRELPATVVTEDAHGGAEWARDEAERIVEGATVVPAPGRRA